VTSGSDERDRTTVPRTGDEVRHALGAHAVDLGQAYDYVVESRVAHSLLGERFRAAVGAALRAHGSGAHEDEPLHACTPRGGDQIGRATDVDRGVLRRAPRVRSRGEVKDGVRAAHGMVSPRPAARSPATVSSAAGTGRA
jgi:hypothetical protein